MKALKIVKKLVIKSYTKDYYIARYDEIETKRMKASLQNEFTSFVKFLGSYLWLSFYTFIIDVIINTFLIIGLMLIEILVILLTYILYKILIYL